MRADARKWLAELLCVALLGCSAPSHATCPQSTHEDAARASVIEARLASVAEGRALLDAARDRIASVCFGDASSASVITTERVAILAEGLEPGEAAARLGHLLVHARDGLPIDAVHAGLEGAACDAAVDRALALEARAYVVEVALQHTLEARPRALAFEFASAALAAPPEAREPIVLAYLRAHPSGAPGMDGLADAYRARCR